MNKYQIKIVQDSFNQLHPISDRVAETFYSRLFEIAPEYKEIFKNDLRKQGALLMSTLWTDIQSLDDIKKILPAVQALGRRHKDYGVAPEHYWRAAEAFLWTLQYYLGSDFTSELREAWMEAYTTLADAMIEVATR